MFAWDWKTMDKENLQFKSIPEITEENEVIFWYVWGRGGLFTYTSYKIGYIEVLHSRKANSLMASLVKPRVTWFSFENVDMFVGHENCRTKTSFIYTVENIEMSYIVFFSAIITSTICLLDLS